MRLIASESASHCFDALGIRTGTYYCLITPEAMRSVDGRSPPIRRPADKQRPRRPDAKLTELAVRPC